MHVVILASVSPLTAALAHGKRCVMESMEVLRHEYVNEERKERVEEKDPELHLCAPSVYVAAPPVQEV
ncbi:hypothetical protein E2C01_021159 [Portunus trituberculatus]|uniref:Secreted protein n=1 Tax=Portunus trituberculatus TaxID=210409 RepID=A0A5B7E3P2_PORTR|nr:hypothetical protein [Portunus trituberculatus]